MSRLILTFETMFQVLAADKLLRQRFSCRPTPTPSGLSTSICSVSLELLEQAQKNEALAVLEENELGPQGVHEV